jgi:hypothetical protein
MPTLTAAAMTARNAGFQMVREASTVRPSPSPTAMAAGRLRPARLAVLASARRLPGTVWPTVSANSASEVEVAAVGAFQAGPIGSYGGSAGPVSVPASPCAPALVSSPGTQ